MIEIRTIDNIVHPVFMFDDRPTETRELIDRIIAYASRHGTEEERLFIITPSELGNSTEIDEGQHPDYARFVAGFFEQSAKIVRDVHAAVRHLFVGKTVDYNTSLEAQRKSEFPHRLGLRFKNYLEGRGLTISPEAELIGHGTMRRACVDEVTKDLGRAMGREYHGDTSHFRSIRFPEDTSL